MLTNIDISVLGGRAGSHARTVAEAHQTQTCFPFDSRQETLGQRRTPQSQTGLTQELGKPGDTTSAKIDAHMLLCISRYGPLICFKESYKGQIR